MTYIDLDLTERADRLRDLAIEKAINEVLIDRNAPVRLQALLPHIHARFGRIPYRYQPFAEMPDPASFDAPIEQLQQTLKILSNGQGTTDPISTNGRFYPANPVLLKVESARSDLEGWSGKAAQAFKTKYLVPFPAITHNQFVLVAALKSALEAEQAMWLAAKHDINAIAAKTSLRLQEMHSCDSTRAILALTVAAAIIPVAAPIVAGSGATAIGIAAVAATARSVAAVAGQSKPELEIAGDCAKDVITSMEHAMDRLAETIEQAEEQIQRSLNSLNDTVHQQQADANPDNQIFYTRRPALADASKRNIRHDMGYAH